MYFHINFIWYNLLYLSKELGFSFILLFVCFLALFIQLFLYYFYLWFTLVLFWCALFSFQKLKLESLIVFLFSCRLFLFSNTSICIFSCISCFCKFNSLGYNCAFTWVFRNNRKTQINLEDIVLREITQTERDKHCVISLLCGI